MRWRVLIGPLIILLAAAAVTAINWPVQLVVAPGPFFVWAIVFSAYFGGLGSGLVGAGIAMVFAVLHLSEPGQLFTYTSEHWSRLTLMLWVAPAIALTVGVLSRRERAALSREREARTRIEDAGREMARLRSALDQVDYGVVLLDVELRAKFINRAFRRIWDLPDEKADAQPAFVGLMYHSRMQHAYAVPSDELDGYIATRVAAVRRGDTAPLDLRFANGTVIRFRCTALPDGGRLLTYTDVSDFVQQSEQLARLARLDDLSGLYNRRHFITLAEAEWERARRYSRPLAMLLLDIDAFKSINDRFGHAIGDQAIVRVSEALREAERVSDVVGRIGGEEFALLLPETSASAADAVAQRICDAIGQQPFRAGTELIDVTVSIGVATALPSMSGIADLVRSADAALYAAKRGGRNRIAHAPALDDGSDVFSCHSA